MEDEPLERARERTTSPLQMGHVRRRVVSQGVLRRCGQRVKIEGRLEWETELTCTRRGTHVRRVGS